MTLDARSSALASAVASAQELLDGLPESPMSVGLSLRLGLASAGYLTGTAQRVRMADSAALNAFRDDGPALGYARAWPVFVRERLEPLGRLMLDEALATGMVEAVAAGRLADARPSLVRDYYTDRAAGEPWMHVELLGRLGRCQGVLDEVPNHRDGLDAMRDRLREVTLRCQEWSARMLSTWAAGRAGGDAHRGRGIVHQAAMYEAMADALADRESRALTFALTTDGYLEDHWRAVSEQAGEPVRLDVLVASDDRWLQALTTNRRRANGMHVRGHCILLSRSVGETARAQQAIPRLNHTLVHEIVHASQRDRLLPRRPPFDAVPWRVELALLEGATERHTRRVMGRARTRWAGLGKNPYSAKDWEKSAYVGYVGVCAGIQKVVAPDDNDGFWVRLSHSPHRMSYITEGLTGRQDRLALEAVIAVLDRLIREAWERERRARDPCARDPRAREDMVGLTERALREFQAQVGEIPPPPVE